MKELFSLPLNLFIFRHWLKVKKLANLTLIAFSFFLSAYDFNVWLTIPEKEFTLDLLNSTSTQYQQTKVEIMNKVRFYFGAVLYWPLKYRSGW